MGPLAQWLELPAHNRLVAGSNPAGPINTRLVRVFSLIGAFVRLSKIHRYILKSIHQGSTLKSHRYLDGTKTYQLHPLTGNAEVINRVTVDYLKEHGLIDSNKKFPAATYLLTPKGQRVVEELKDWDI